MYQRRRRIPPRHELPPNPKEKLALMCFIFGGVLLLWYEVCHILPTYYGQSGYWNNEVLIHCGFAVFFAINIYGNMFKLVTMDTSHKWFLLSSGNLLPDGWRYCALCDLNLPPRSHHCKICDTCILKRDHHCWFAGYCIGYYNQRYYVAMVIHMVAAGLYCNIFNLSFVVSIKGHLTLMNLLSYIAPHVGWMLGYYDKYVFAITSLTTIGSILFILFSWLLYIQVTQIYGGQTNNEIKKKVRRYNRGLLQNIKEVLGYRWFLVLLFPWIRSPLPGDGAKFNSKFD